MEEESSLQRSRSSRACDQCRRKKIRCNIKQNASVCSNCEQNNIECTFNDSTKKRGPPKGYIEALESRLRRMENVIMQSIIEKTSLDEEKRVDLDKIRQEIENTPTLFSLKDNPIRKTRAKQNTNQQLPIHTSSPLSTINCNNFEQSSSDDNEDDDSEMSSRMEQLYLENSSSLSYLDDPHDVVFETALGPNKPTGMFELPMLHTKGVQVFASRTARSTNTFLVLRQKEEEPIEKIIDMPPKEISDSLIDAYFERIHSFIPVLHKTQFLKQYRGEIEPFPSRFLLNCIFSIASHFCNLPDLGMNVSNNGGHGGAFMASIFRERAQKYISLNPNISNLSYLQGLIILMGGERIYNPMQKTISLSGTAAKVAHELGLHRSTKLLFSPAEMETRRRTWWTLYQLDRENSALTGRPMIFHDMDCDVDFPSEYDIDEEDTSISSESQTRIYKRTLTSLYFHHCSKLCKIVGRILSALCTPAGQKLTAAGAHEPVVQQLLQELREWRTSLPPELAFDDDEIKVTRGASHFSDILQITYSLVRMRLHRACLRAEKHTNANSPALLSLWQFSYQTVRALELVIKKQGIYIAEMMFASTSVWLLFLNTGRIRGSDVPPEVLLHFTRILVLAVRLLKRCSYRESFFKFFNFILAYHRIRLDRDLWDSVVAEFMPYFGDFDDECVAESFMDPDIVLQKFMSKSVLASSQNPISFSHSSSNPSNGIHFSLESSSEPPRKRVHAESEDASAGPVNFTRTFSPVSLASQPDFTFDPSLLLNTHVYGTGLNNQLLATFMDSSVPTQMNDLLNEFGYGQNLG
ncbi:uncharacterized protein VTP21DRAFT_5689 [Calcarisporiella thermophila]|uniref:uncharacterized protein n=1 Tax=Calcarisporiella thermophila TaxID=911321 RepID=UPI0037442D93